MVNEKVEMILAVESLKAQCTTIYDLVNSKKKTVKTTKDEPANAEETAAAGPVVPKAQTLMSFMQQHVKVDGILPKLLADYTVKHPEDTEIAEKLKDASLQTKDGNLNQVKWRSYLVQYIEKNPNNELSKLIIAAKRNEEEKNGVGNANAAGTTGTTSAGAGAAANGTAAAHNGAPNGASSAAAVIPPAGTLSPEEEAKVAPFGRRKDGQPYKRKPVPKKDAKAA
jgi:hypothetical protein